MDIFWTTFLLIFIAEIADKSRIVGLFLASTYHAPWAVFWGMTLGYVVVDGLAVIFGSYMNSFLSPFLIKMAAGVIFLIFGILSFIVRLEMQAGPPAWFTKIEKFGPLVVSLLAISVSEMADRTQLVSAALAAETGRPILVFSAVISALAALNALTVWIGKKITDRVSPKTIRVIAGIGFLLIGIYLLLTSKPS